VATASQGTILRSDARFIVSAACGNISSRQVKTPQPQPQQKEIQLSDEATHLH
jgi:hypothetical protein